MLLVLGLSRHVVSQADRGERNEAEVEGLQVGPVLQRREDGGGDEEEATQGQKGEHSGVNDGDEWLRQIPLPVQVHDRPPCAEHHDSLHHGCEEEEGEGDSDDSVDDAEDLPAL